MDLPLPCEVAPFPQAQTESMRFCPPKLLPIISSQVLKTEAASRDE
eukprot:XP_001705215.1 Hypothetical protein GL50803_5448 [Giardia lamblia ATCC 50803]